MAPLSKLSHEMQTPASFHNSSQVYCMKKATLNNDRNK